MNDILDVKNLCRQNWWIFCCKAVSEKECAKDNANILYGSSKSKENNKKILTNLARINTDRDVTTATSLGGICSISYYWWAITPEWEYKNCESMKKSFWNLRDYALRDLIIKWQQEVRRFVWGIWGIPVCRSKYSIDWKEHTPIYTGLYPKYLTNIIPE